MSQPVSRYLNPFDVPRHPTLEPEVKHAIIASWAYDRRTLRDNPTLRMPLGTKSAVHDADVLAALKSIDHNPLPDEKLQ